MTKTLITIALTTDQQRTIMDRYANDPRATNQAGVVKRKRAIECFINDALAWAIERDRNKSR